MAGRPARADQPVADDLRRQGVRETGRRGLPAESVLRCALLEQQRQLSYEELAFHLEDCPPAVGVVDVSGKRKIAWASEFARGLSYYQGR
jgi:hypothetical protein